MTVPSARWWMIGAVAALLVALAGPLVSAEHVAEAARPPKPGIAVVRLLATTDFLDSRGVVRAITTPSGRRFSVLAVVPTIAPGEILDVFVGPDKLGSMAVTAEGTARLELRARRGDTVPSLTSGTAIAIKTDAGTTVVQGQAQ